VTQSQIAATVAALLGKDWKRRTGGGSADRGRVGR
jgi:hypothetical protein